MSADPGSSTRPAGAAAPRPRTGSGFVARLLTVMYALVITPIATGLISYGGSGWLQLVASRGYLDSSLADLLVGPLGVRILAGLGGGGLLLASVALTGIASSAGLLGVGVIGLGSLAVSAMPGLLLEIYGAIPEVVPMQVLDGFAYGLPLVLHTVMGGLGLGLVITRRRPDPHLAASLLGLVAVPLVLLVGALLVGGGIGHGVLVAMRTFDSRFSPLTALLVVLGALLLGLGATASRWSPYSLVVPALVLLVGTVAASMSGTLPLVAQAWSSPTAFSALAFLLLGGGVVLAVILLVHTAVLAVVRRRARRRLRGAGPVPPPAASPGAHATWSADPA